MHSYWLMKTDPESFSVEDFKKIPKKTTAWDGVRNYQARNFMKSMKSGDLAFFYHSNDEHPAIRATCKIVREAYPDPTQFDPKSKYYDEKATPQNPRWFLVDLQLNEILKQPITLSELRTNPKLSKMVLLQKGSRLSVQPVTKEEWEAILTDNSR